MTEGATRFNILLVDDRSENLLALEAALSGLGQNVVKARSGKEALRQILLHEFIVILLDVNMPEMDGFETATLIRQRRKTEFTPIIFVTAATSSDPWRSRGYALGAVDYLFTPIEPEVLRAKVAVFIDLARRAEAARTLVEDERAAAERRATRLESRLQSLFNRLDVGIFRSTLDGGLREANPALLRLLGVDSVTQARERARDRSDGGSLQALLSYRIDGEALQEQGVELVQPDGKSAHVSVTKTLGTDPDGERIVEGLVTDVTKRKRSEDEREQLLASERSARSDAELANRLKDEFLATLSHELRTPLHAILGWAEVLRQSSPENENGKLGIEAIKRNAQAQTRLIDDLLDMNRIISGKIRLDVRSVALGSVIDEVAESLQPASLAKEIQVEKEIEPGCEPVAADPDRIQQIVWNLLSNAIKFTAKGGHVRVSLQRVGSTMQIGVTDDGQGIRADFLPHIFGRFRQADASSTRQQGGLGLGLAIVKHLVEMHGGTVTAHSDGLGLGARFVVLLPIAAARSLAPVADEPARRNEELPVAALADPSTLNGVRLLVVDDVLDARELMRLQLEECGAVIRTAESAQQALAMLDQELPDVLVSDIGMADFDGYHLIARVRARGPANGGSIPAVAVTAFARPEDRARALDTGYDDYLVKPVESWRLIQTIAELLRKEPRNHTQVAGR